MVNPSETLNGYRIYQDNMEDVNICLLYDPFFNKELCLSSAEVNNGLGHFLRC